MQNPAPKKVMMLKNIPFKSILSTIWNDPWKRIAASAGVVATYLLIVASLRFQRLRSIKHQYRKYARREDMANMTIHDAWAIQKHILQLEFPSAALKALQFALFRTYGIPSISSLLLKTSQFSNTSTSFKRYADTGALIGQFMAFEPTSDRAITAIARTRFLHIGYRNSGKILEDDMLYTLSLFALEPIRFVGLFEWRSMSELERCAIGTYWKYIGDALGISYEQLPSGKTGFYDGLHFLDEIGKWSRKYEEDNMKPNVVNKEVADRTMDVLVYPLPRGLKNFGIHIASCTMDDRLREAMMYDRPSWIYRLIFSSIMGTRKFFLRHLSLPRPYFLRSDVFTDEPNEYGRFYVRVWVAAPYYVQPTFLNRWGPGAWISRMLGLPLPGDEGDKYYPNGYDTADLGPKYFEGKGRKTVQDIKDELWRQMKERPFEVDV